MPLELSCLKRAIFAHNNSNVYGGGLGFANVQTWLDADASNCGVLWQCPHILLLSYIADLLVTLTPAVDPLEGNTTDNITLTCSWNSTVFYLVWFKDGAPLYSRDLVSGDTVDSTSTSVTVEVEGLSSTLTFSQVSDSGNYTCAVTCRAKDSAEEGIPVQFRATKEVLVYGELTTGCR